VRGRRWPDFFIVGAPRCGTTSLWHHLRRHPDIFMSPVKEPNFFAYVQPRTHDAIGRPIRGVIITDEDVYLGLFERAKGGQLLGEASVSYFSNSAAPVRIKQKNAQAKIIAILRQPVDRAFSNYLLCRRDGSEPRSTFLEALLDDYRCFRQAPDDSRYIGVGFYAKHLQRWLDTFGPARVKVYLYEDLERDTARIVNDICEFLDVPWYGGRFFDPNERLNAHGEPRGKLGAILLRMNLPLAALRTRLMRGLNIKVRDMLVRTADKPPIEPEAAAFLRDLYKDDILQLQELIGRDLSHWLRDQ